MMTNLPVSLLNRTLLPTLGLPTSTSMGWVVAVLRSVVDMTLFSWQAMGISKRMIPVHSGRYVVDRVAHRSEGHHEWPVPDCASRRPTTAPPSRPLSVPHSGRLDGSPAGKSI